MTRLHRKHRIALGLGLGLLLGFGGTTVQAAGDAALYEAVAPKGSTFVRLYNASNQEVSANVGSINLEDVSPLSSSGFEYLPAGQYSARVGSQNLPVNLSAEHYYTLVTQSGAAPLLVEEPAFKSKQKALLRVQNLSDKPLTLKTADGKTEVVKSVEPKGRGDREINPVKANLALFDGERKVADLKPISLARGEVVCLYVTGTANQLNPVWVKPPVKE
ncbi:Alginate biosynthesis protein [Azotobacter vinelandii CA]|uniref:Alginate biosynthesis protein AlgF n=3 Tax=Azotobacter vinelandii TaxID=354 RepID=ALGF_AZOVI|nr:alginate O-acetyltransferase AlgF [Azotobacter vinelandii]P70799.1 RecName: Full=Alginate biosynthesis protein AlgF; Flags: Precursor [Azotobacter vinelandii]ACO77318.1 Alginate biosynthesis protein [Azotobacter vinelandii DJ]AGK13238.1 Alginate biosynthesis protein [Azotobacter vinelandii CA]AGK17525.1 Alginate biosynthesis protein [Azotobacter vinelandii CA6]WKN22993.1 alginate O-acetyltransferase AlgF [Azotobacter vinelandii]CAA67490.1 AlgF protein [Azotobacter vinelandii]